MTTVVLDTNVVLPWILDDVADVAARRLREQCDRREIDAVVPSMLLLEVVNVVGRRWRWPPADVAMIAEALLALPWRVQDPSLLAVADWVGRGLTAYDATYVALAAALGCQVVTRDRAMLSVAGALATALPSSPS